jgi:hypothetical protein
MGGPTNNFRREENKARAIYKLKVYLKPAAYSKYKGEKSLVRFGYITDPDKGLGRLRRYAHSIQEDYTWAILYSNQGARNELERYKGV